MVPFEATAPEGRVFVMGDNRVDSADSSMRLGDEGRGTLPLSEVRGEAVERPTALIVVGGAQVLGLFAFIVGAGPGIAAWVARRRAAAGRGGQPPPPPGRSPGHEKAPGAATRGRRARGPTASVPAGHG